jgi:thiol-disulfide isomerase/thioredoxin
MKPVIPWLLLLSLAGTAAFAQDGMMAPPAESEQGGSMMMSGSASRIIPFQDLSTARLLAAQGPTVLFFSASWCPTCRAAMRELEAGYGRLGDTVVVVVDYDRSGDLKKRYGVTYQHTWVQIDSEGRKLAVWSGGGVDEILRKVVR